MMRHLIPRVDWGSWGGGALTGDGRDQDDVAGGCIVVQWLGILVEIGVGRVQ